MKTLHAFLKLNKHIQDVRNAELQEMEDLTSARLQGNQPV